MLHNIYFFHYAIAVPRIHDLSKLDQVASSIRELIITSLLEAKSGHSAGSLGMTDVFTALYFHVMSHDPKKPNWEDRDRLLLSNGHICPVLYATLAEAGYFPNSELKTLRKINSRLQGHPHYGALPGVENSGGPLGQGLSQGVGIALAHKMDGRRSRVYVAMGDGEQNEGQVWEAYMLAGKHRLSNLTVLIDRNNIQIDGYTEDIMPLQPFASKIEAFRWNVLDVDGHNIEAVIDACNQAMATQEQPTAIICNTIPGKGVEFMEDKPIWHGKPPNKTEAKDAIKQLRSLSGQIECSEYV